MAAFVARGSADINTEGAPYLRGDTPVYGRQTPGAGIDILPDGRFMLARTPKADNREIVIVQNWFDEVRRLAPLPARP